MIGARRGTGDPRVASPIIYEGRRRLALRHRGGAIGYPRSGGREDCYRELRRIPIPRTPVNKGTRKRAGASNPVLHSSGPGPRRY
jgi:hypothetical protein